jgi:hypothetical protein
MTYDDPSKKILQVGDRYRFSGASTSQIAKIDGVSNWYWVTDSPGPKLPSLNLGMGIYSPKSRSNDETELNPLIVCTMAAHRHASNDVPWTDQFVESKGLAIYSGDSKRTDSVNPYEKLGNSRLIESWRQISSLRRDLRLMAAPVILVSSEDATGKPGKGYRRVLGLFYIEAIALILENQWVSSHCHEFPNFSFTLRQVDLSTENNCISMAWLNARRTDEIPLEECYELAPKAWRSIVDLGIRQPS